MPKANDYAETIIWGHKYSYFPRFSKTCSLMFRLFPNVQRPALKIGNPRLARNCGGIDSARFGFR